MTTFRPDACPLQIKTNVTLKKTTQTWTKMKNNSALYTENRHFLSVNTNINVMLH